MPKMAEARLRECLGLDNVISEDQDSLIRVWKDENGVGFHLDLRAFIESGGEPYAIIMRYLADITDSFTLVVHAPFEPRPLEMHAKQMGYMTRLYREGMDHYCLEFKKPLEVSNP